MRASRFVRVLTASLDTQNLAVWTTDPVGQAH